MSTISNERLEKLSEYDCADRYEVMSMAAELLALRKEREASVPVAIIDQANLDYLKSGADADVWPPEREEMGDIPLYTAPPTPPVAVPVVPAAYEINSDATDYHRGWNACRATMLAAPPVDYDSLPFDPQIAEYEQMMEAELKAAARTAYKVKSELSQMAEKLVRDTTALAATLSAETDTTAQQFAALAGKAVGGWIPCSERMPEDGTDADGNAIGYLVLYEAGKEPNGSFNVGVWNVTYLRSWWKGYVTHWMPLPSAPEPCK